MEEKREKTLLCTRAWLASRSGLKFRFALAFLAFISWTAVVGAKLTTGHPAEVSAVDVFLVGTSALLAALAYGRLGDSRSTER